MTQRPFQGHETGVVSQTGGPRLPAYGGAVGDQGSVVAAPTVLGYAFYEVREGLATSVGAHRRRGDERRSPISESGQAPTAATAEADATLRGSAQAPETRFGHGS
jgi:hypothetical protein